MLDPASSAGDAALRRALARKVLGAAPYRIGSLAVVRLVAAARLMVFARLFLPEVLGTASLALISVGALSVLANFGVFPSIIRRREDSRAFEDTAFTFSLCVALGLFALTLLCAPLLARLLGADIGSLLRFAAFLVFAIPLQFPRVFWEKEIDFVHPSVAAVIPELVAFASAVALELGFGLGVWSLLAGHVCGTLCGGAYVWALARRRPRLRVRAAETGELLRFGTPLMLQRANGWVMARGDNLLVGACAGAAQLAYYNFSWQLPMMISALATSVDSMLLPVFARLDHDREQMARLFEMASKMWSIAGSFFGFGMIVFADVIVHLLYGPKWSEAVPLLQLMAVSFVIRFCTGYAYDNVALVRGRTPYMMKWGFANTAFILTLGLGMIQRWGALGGAWFWVIQATCVTPLLRLPLIWQELGSLRFVRHVWQPLLSGAVAAAVAAELRRGAPAFDVATVLACGMAYVGSYAAVLLLVDRSLVADTRKLRALAR